MALDPNILLQGVVPDIGKAASEGFDLGQRIRNAPLLRQQAERKAQIDDQALQKGTEDEGTREAVALYQAAGDSPITADNYAQVIATLQRGGHRFDEFELQVTPENIATANQFKDMGKQSLLSARGKELQGWQSFAPQITVDPESGEQYFNIPQSNRQTGESRVQRVRVEDIIANNQGLTPKQQIQQAGGTATAVNEAKNLADTSAATDKKSNERLGSLRGDILAEEATNFRNIKSQEIQLNQLEEALASADTGKFAQLKAYLGKYAPGVNVDNEQALQSLTSSYALDELSKQSGTKTDFDFLKAAETQVQSGNTKGANKMILERLKDKTERGKDRWKRFSEFKKNNKNFEDFEDIYSYDETVIDQGNAAPPLTIQSGRFSVREKK